MSQPRLTAATRVFLAFLMAALLLAAHAFADDDGRKVVGGYFEEWSIYFANFNIANLQANGVNEQVIMEMQSRYPRAVYGPPPAMIYERPPSVVIYERYPPPPPCGVGFYYGCGRRW